MNLQHQPAQITSAPANDDGRIREALDAEVRSDLSVSALRLAFDSLTRLLNTGLPDLADHHEAIRYRHDSSATLDVLVPNGAGPHPVLVYLHGGAWVAGSPASHRKLTARFAEAGLLVLSVDYRLAPEYPFPAGLDDCVAAVDWAAANAARFGADRLPPSFIIVGRQDPLLQQSQRLRDALLAAGTDHRYVEAASMPHGFMQMEFLGGVRRLVRDMAGFLHAQQPAPPRFARLRRAWSAMGHAIRARVAALRGR